MAVNQRVKELRGEVSQTLFAKKFDVTPSTISGIESGKSQPSIELALKICEYYGCTMDWLIRGIGEKKVIENKNVISIVNEEKVDYKAKYIESLEEINRLQKVENEKIKAGQRVNAL